MRATPYPIRISFWPENQPIPKVRTPVFQASSIPSRRSVTLSSIACFYKSLKHSQGAVAPAAPMLPVAPLNWESSLPLATGAVQCGSKTMWTHPPDVSSSMFGHSVGPSDVGVARGSGGGVTGDVKGHSGLKDGEELLEALLGVEKRGGQSSDSGSPNDAASNRGKPHAEGSMSSQSKESRRQAGRAASVADPLEGSMQGVPIGGEQAFMMNL